MSRCAKLIDYLNRLSAVKKIKGFFNYSKYYLRGVHTYAVFNNI